MFDCQLHGKFYRFYRDGSLQDGYNLTPVATSARSAVEHFWLCEDCSRVFTLAWERDAGILLRQHRSEHAATERSESIIA
jgi:hypothetical protein